MPTSSEALRTNRKHLHPAHQTTSSTEPEVLVSPRNVVRLPAVTVCDVRGMCSDGLCADDVIGDPDFRRSMTRAPVTTHTKEALATASDVSLGNDHMSVSPSPRASPTGMRHIPPPRPNNNHQQHSTSPPGTTTTTHHLSGGTTTCHDMEHAIITKVDFANSLMEHVWQPGDSLVENSLVVSGHTAAATAAAAPRRGVHVGVSEKKIENNPAADDGVSQTNVDQNEDESRIANIAKKSEIGAESVMKIRINRRSGELEEGEYSKRSNTANKDDAAEELGLNEYFHSSTRHLVSDTKLSHTPKIGGGDGRNHEANQQHHERNDEMRLDLQSKREEDDDDIYYEQANHNGVIVHNVVSAAPTPGRECVTDQPERRIGILGPLPESYYGVHTYDPNLGRHTWRLEPRTAAMFAPVAIVSRLPGRQLPTKPLLGSPRRLGQIPGQETTGTSASYRPNRQRHTLYGTAVKQLWSSCSGEAIDQYKHRAKHPRFPTKPGNACSSNYLTDNPTTSRSEQQRASTSLPGHQSSENSTVPASPKCSHDAAREENDAEDRTNNGFVAAAAASTCEDEESDIGHFLIDDAVELRRQRKAADTFKMPTIREGSSELLQKAPPSSARSVVSTSRSHNKTAEVQTLMADIKSRVDEVKTKVKVPPPFVASPRSERALTRLTKSKHSKLTAFLNGERKKSGGQQHDQKKSSSSLGSNKKQTDEGQKDDDGGDVENARPCPHHHHHHHHHGHHHHGHRQMTEVNNYLGYEGIKAFLIEEGWEDLDGDDVAKQAASSFVDWSHAYCSPGCCGGWTPGRQTDDNNHYYNKDGDSASLDMASRHAHNNHAERVRSATSKIHTHIVSRRHSHVGHHSSPHLHFTRCPTAMESRDRRRRLEDVVLRHVGHSDVMRHRRREPRPQPGKLCLTKRIPDITHAEVVSAVEAMHKDGKVKVKSLQYDPVYLKGFTPTENKTCRWILELEPDSNPDFLVRSGVTIKGKNVPVRYLDNELAKEYANYQKFYNYCRAIKLRRRLSSLNKRLSLDSKLAAAARAVSQPRLSVVDSKMAAA